MKEHTITVTNRMSLPHDEVARLRIDRYHGDSNREALIKALRTIYHESSYEITETINITHQRT